MILIQNELSVRSPL